MVMDGDQHPANQRFPKTDRVVKQSDFDRIHDSQSFAADKHLVVKGARNDLSKTRLGLSISRRVGNAVVRNRWKRTIREAFRTNREKIPAGWDFVVRPRKGAVLDANKIARSLINLSRRIESDSTRRTAKSKS